MKKILCSIMILLYSSTVFSQSLSLVTLEYPPYIYEVRNEVKGMAVDIIREVFKRMDIVVDIKVFPWLRALKKIELGEADAVFTVYKTDERMIYIDYSNEVVIQQIVSLFVRSDSEIVFSGNVNDLAEYKIGVVRGVSYGTVIDVAVESKQLKNIFITESGDKSFSFLLANRADIIVSNKYGAYYILDNMNKKGLVKELQPEVESIPSYIGFSKARNLKKIRDIFDEVLMEMKNDGTYNEILELYSY